MKNKRLANCNRPRLEEGKGRKILLALLLTALMFCAGQALATEKWPGVDEVVVEKIAAEHGRQASGPLLDTDQGDLLLFLFLLAGVVAGFTAGYYWQVLIAARVGPAQKDAR